MKRLEKLLLINWHYFSFETLEFSEINFLTGKNASGKTTIIDAIQLLLLGDTTGHFFNKSASDKSSRSLKGYLRCEIGDQDDGSALYLRNGRFSSYVALQFFDTFTDSHFTIGIVFDNYEDGNFTYKYFSYDDQIPDNNFISLNLPLDQKSLRAFFQHQYSGMELNFYETNVSYREFIKEKLGNLNNNFFSLFKKAIPFSPITNIETFITEYVCDVKNTIDITSMQENIRHYKQLEIDSMELTKRVEQLNNIVTRYQQYQLEQENHRVNQYLVQRSELYLSNQAYEQLGMQITDLSNELEDKQRILTGCDEQLKNARVRRDQLVEEKFSSDLYQQQATLQEKEDLLNREIHSLEGKINRVVKGLQLYASDWLKEAKYLQQTMDDQIQGTPLETYLNQLLTCLEQIVSADVEELDEPLLHTMQQMVTVVYEAIRERSYQVSDQLRLQKENKERLEQEKQTLASGNKPYDSKLQLFRQVISQELELQFQKKIEVNFLADCMDIKDESWRPVIETFLNYQRFYLMIDPLYVDAAISIYDRVRNQYQLSDFGIIDTQKVVTNAPTPKNGSLFDELKTKDEATSAYLAGILGNLMKCHDLSQLRNHPRSITKTGMLYQSYVARQLNLSRTKPFIGFRSLKDQVHGLEDQIGRINMQIDVYEEDLAAYQRFTKLEQFSTSDVRNTLEQLVEKTNLTLKQEELKQVEDSLSSLGGNYLESLERKISESEILIKELEEEKAELSKEIFQSTNKLERIQQEDYPQIKANTELLKKAIAQRFNKQWMLQVGEPAFVDGLQEYQKPSALVSSLKVKTEKTESKLISDWSNLIEARIRYSTTYQTTNDVNAHDNTYYDGEYHDLGTIKLGEYKVKIQEAKTNALSQFRNDFLAKLKSNFDMVISQIESLNDALLHSKFGSDSYLFIVTPRAEYKNYYDMINDPMLLMGQDITSDAFQVKYGDTIEDLFRQITFVDIAVDMRSELERNIEKFTDYRSYLKFDLIVTDGNGNKQRLSRTLLKKSGGETQTPFYISVLASFAQAYRVYNTNERYSSIRLIIFDEAFSKMDSERIQESVRLLRNFGLQAIVSAPPEKMADIVPLVDKTLCVVRSNTISTVRDFTYQP